MKALERFSSTDIWLVNSSNILHIKQIFSETWDRGQIPKSCESRKCLGCYVVVAAQYLLCSWLCRDRGMMWRVCDGSRVSGSCRTHAPATDANGQHVHPVKSHLSYTWLETGKQLSSFFSYTLLQPDRSPKEWNGSFSESMDLSLYSMLRWLK